MKKYEALSKAPKDVGRRSGGIHKVLSYQSCTRLLVTISEFQFPAQILTNSMHIQLTFHIGGERLSCKKIQTEPNKLLAHSSSPIAPGQWSPP